LYILDTCSEFILSFDGSCKDDDDSDDDSSIKYCLISKHTLERMSLVIRNQLDASDQDLGKLQVPDIASISPVLPSPSLSQLMHVFHNLQLSFHCISDSLLLCFAVLCNNML